MKDLTQQYVEQLENMVKDLREKKLELEEENKSLAIENAKLKDRIITDENFEEKLDKENKKLKEELSKLKEKYWDIDY